MKTLEKIVGLLYGIKVLFRDFMVWSKKQTEFYMAILAGSVWLCFWISHLVFKTESYAIGLFQKIAFGILAMSIISGVTFFWMKKTQPFYFNLLDPDTQGGINNISEWERIKIGLFFFAFFGGGTVLLAALY